MSALPHRPLGASDLEVSAFALGSWRTYERISREAGRRRAAGGARGRHRVPRGRPLQRRDGHARRSRPATPRSSSARSSAASGWPRDEVTIATKLWWEFWPGRRRRRSSTASLERTGLERFDFVYSDPPPPELPMAEVVGAVAELVTTDGARLGHRQLAGRADRRGGAVARELGVAPPCAAQLPYSLSRATGSRPGDDRGAWRAAPRSSPPTCWRAGS